VPEADHILHGSAAWDQATRLVVQSRLHDPPKFKFFSPAQARTLEVLTSRLLPQDDRPPGDRVPVAARIDALLTAGEVDGYRKGDQPWPEDWWPVGLASLDVTASALSGVVFADLTENDRDDIILAAAHDTVPGDLWQRLPAPAFIAGAVDQMVSVYYADPRAWAEIGWAGPANPRGYLRTGYGRRDPWEPPAAPTSPAHAPGRAALETSAPDRARRDREGTP
jgi:hypothetical protein